MYILHVQGDCKVNTRHSDQWLLSWICLTVSCCPLFLKGTGTTNCTTTFNNSHSWVAKE